MVYKVFKRAIERNNLPNGVDGMKESITLAEANGMITTEQLVELMAMLEEM